MSIARISIDRPIYTWIIILGCLFGGLWGFNSVGRLEDPAFTIKSAVVITQYPGATAMQVAREVSEPLESAIQKMGEVNRITSINQPGFSQITVEIQDTYDGTQLPDIWSDLRAKVGDAAGNLPDGVTMPQVNDGFGDVFGIFYAVTAPGFSDAEVHQLSTFLRREILAVDGVADVDVSGLPDEAIFVEPNLAVTFNQNIPPAALINAISTANSVQPAGSVDGSGQDVDILAPEGSDTISAIAGLAVGVGGEVINLFDIAEVNRRRQTEPSSRPMTPAPITTRCSGTSG